MKYRKIPVEVEVFQYAGVRKSDLASLAEYLFNECPKWLSDAWDEGVILFEGEMKSLFIKTLEGVMKVNAGDYIIRGIQGEIYPCKPDIFEQTYEPVEDKTEDKTGKWIHTWEDDEWYGELMGCSNCGDSTLDFGNYCPTCGMAMGQEEENDAK